MTTTGSLGDHSWLPFIAAIQPNRLRLYSAVSFYVLIAANLSFFFFFFSPPRHFPSRRVTQSNIFVNHPFPSRLFLTIMAGFTVVGCLLAALSPFKVCFSQFNGSPIHHTLAVPVCLRGGGDLLSSWKLLRWCCHLVKRETLLSDNYEKINVLLKRKKIITVSAISEQLFNIPTLTFSLRHFGKLWS